MPRYRGRVYTPNPVSKWPGNEGLAVWWLGLPELSGGPQLYDLVQRTPGALTNGPTWAADRNGFGAVAFDGTDDFAVSPTVPPIGPVDNYAIACAVYPRGTTGEQVYWGCGFDIGFGEGYFLECESGNFKVAFPSVARFDSGVAVVTGKWYYLLHTRRASSNFLYIGDPGAGTFTEFALAAGTPPAPTNAGNSFVLMGAQSNTANRPGNAIVASGAFWGRPQSLAEATGHYDQWLRGYPDALNRVSSRVWSFATAAPATQVLQDLAHTPEHQAIMAM